MGKVSVEYEIVCLDENGGISRAIRGAFASLDKAVAVAAARAPEYCSRILLCEIENDEIVWQGSRADALKAVARTEARNTAPETKVPAAKHHTHVHAAAP